MSENLFLLLFVANTPDFVLPASLEVSWMTGEPGNYISVVSRIYAEIVGATKVKLDLVCHINFPCWHSNVIMIMYYYVSSAAVKVIRPKLLVYSTHWVLD